MAETGVFIGDRDQAPSVVAQKIGSLIPLTESEQVTVCYVPTGVNMGSSELITLSESVTRLFICLEAGAQADIGVWMHDGTVHVLEVILEAGARCSIAHVNAVQGDQPLVITQRMQLGEGSNIRLSNVTLGSALLTHDVSSHVIGAHAESNIDWMFYAKATEKQKLNARNVFDATDGGGEISMRGIAEEKGHAECKGLIEIGLQGGGTNTYLTQEVLMLDSTAKVDAIPALEIKTNDVKASHSATVARVTEEDLFYFGARGIDPEEARRLFIIGFLGSITERVAHGEIRAMILEEVERKFAI